MLCNEKHSRATLVLLAFYWRREEVNLEFSTMSLREGNGVHRLLLGGLGRVKPHDLGELQEVLSDFVESPDKDVARRAVRDVRPRAEMCIKMGGGHFESQLKKYKRGMIEE